MMLRRKNPEQLERLDQVRRELLLAVIVSDEEIQNVTGSPDLLDGLQSRIEAQRGGRGREKAVVSRAIHNIVRAMVEPGRSPRWSLTAAAVLLLAALALMISSPKRSSEETRLAQPVSAQVTPSPSPGVGLNEPAQKTEQTVVVTGASIRHRQRQPSRRQSESRTNEVATDFLPLTFTADSTSQVRGHLVRVTVPRSALVAMGLPMNAQRASELVRADVFIGDDGLARSIRFVQ
jgi:hypothetical protein